MNAMAPTDRSALPGFAGIALADILANGVAVMILLIVITIGTQYEREQEQLEQVDEVSLALSRDLAIAMVMNNLSASAPAYLHDYANSPQDRQLDPRVMPVLELRRDVARDLYTGATWTRAELMLEDNDLDRHLDRFSAVQRRFIRLDVYDVPLFYLAMSILKSHGISPSHWHFMAAAPGGDGGEAGDGDGGGGGGGDNGNGGNGGGGDDGGGDDGGDGEPDASADPGIASGGGLPHGVDIAYGGGTSADYAPATPAAASGAEESAIQMDAAGEPLLGRARFRLAGESGADASQMPVNAVPKVADALRALLWTLNDWQQTYDRGESPTASIARLGAGLGEALSRRVALGAEDSRTVARLVERFVSYWPEDETRLAAKLDDSERPGGEALRVGVNQPLHTVAAAPNTRAYVRRQLPADKQLTVAVSRYPELLAGVLTPVVRDAVLLMPARQQAPAQRRWRAVALVSPAFDDFMLGFVYAALDGDDALIAVDENAVSLDGAPLYSRPAAASTGDRWRLFLYTLGIAALIAAVVRRLARRRGAATGAAMTVPGA